MKLSDERPVGGRDHPAEAGLGAEIAGEVIGGAAGGLASAWLGSKLGGSEPLQPTSPPPPEIELPPGVDRD